jgi:hypothetical protein
MADAENAPKSTFDEALFNRFCIAFSEAGLIGKYLDFAVRYQAPFQDLAPGPNMKNLLKVIQAHGASAKLYNKWRVIEMCFEEIHGWSWLGKLVMKRYNQIEFQFEGRNGIKSIGSNMKRICRVGRGLVSGVDDLPESFPGPRYDGDDERLDRMMGEIVAFFSEVKDMIRRDLPDFPKGTL